MSDLMAFDRLEDITGADAALTAEIVALFIDTTDSYLERLREARRHDNGDWSMASHALKGCCGNFGATALADLARQCEKDAPNDACIVELEALFEQTKRLLHERYSAVDA